MSHSVLQIISAHQSSELLKINSSIYYVLLISDLSFLIWKETKQACNKLDRKNFQVKFSQETWLEQARQYNEKYREQKIHKQ